MIWSWIVLVHIRLECFNSMLKINISNTFFFCYKIYKYVANYYHKKYIRHIYINGYLINIVTTTYVFVISNNL